MLLSLIVVLCANQIRRATAALGELDKRQAFYVCGNYPNQYYSTVPCSTGFNRCANGGRFLGVGCYFDYQCTPYANGQAAQCLNGCCCSSTDGGSTLSVLGFCPSGQRSQVSCTTSSGCASGQTCNNGLCCTTTGNEYQNACGGVGALAACNGGQCGSFICVTSNYCCECQFGRSAGLCSNGCPTGYICSSNGYCCSSCPNGRTPYGVCYQGQCPTGYTCNAGNVCCQN